MKHLLLRHKLFLFVSGIVLLYSIFSVLFVHFFLKDTLREHFISMGKTLASTVASHVTDDMLVSDLVNIDSYFEDTMRNNPDVSYMFIKRDGEVAVHTFGGQFPGDLLRAGHAETQVDYVVVSSGGREYYDFSSPIFGGKAGVLRVGMATDNIDMMLGRTITMFLLVTLGVIAVAFVLSALISRKLTQPLALLTETAAEIAAGNFTALPGASPSHSDEIGRLSRSFGRMADAIREREKELRETNEQLETYGVKMYEYIEELNRTKDELIRAKQDAAVVETSKAVLHHMRQPLTYLIMAIEILTEEIKGSPSVRTESLAIKLRAIDEAGKRLSELLKKFEQLRQYKSVSFSDETRILDIDE